MAVNEIPKIGRKDFIGLSTDTKPTDCAPGSTFYETDTTSAYIFNSGTWVML